VRVLHVNKFLYRRGGAEAYMQDVAEAQVRVGHAVEYFGMRHVDNDPHHYARHFPRQIDFDETVTGTGDRVRALGRMVWSRSARRGMDRTLAGFAPDVVHLHNIYHQLSPSILGPVARRGLASVMTLHDYKLVCPNYRMLCGDEICDACVGRGVTAAVTRRCNRGSLLASIAIAGETIAHRLVGACDSIDTFICPSRFMHDLMVRGGIDSDRLEYIPHFVDAIDAPPKVEPGGHITFVGRLSNEKGLDTAIDALTWLPRSISLDVAGDGPARPALEARAAEVAPGRVRFHGRLAKGPVQDLMRAASVVVFPSRWYENQPLVVLEALALGVPVVATSLGGTTELIEDGRDGALVAADQSETLAAALHRFCADPEGALAAGRRGRARIAAEHSIARHLSELDRVYTGAKDKHARRRRLRVAMIGQRGIPANYGGVERHVEELGARLAAAGHEVTVFCRSEPGVLRTRSHRGMELRTLPTIHTKHLDALVHSALATARTLGRRYDIVHYHAIGPGVFSPIAAVGARAAVVQTVHGLDGQRAKWGPLARALLGLGTWCSARYPDATIVVSDSLRRHYADAYGRATWRIANGVSAPANHPTPSLIRDRWKLHADGYVLFVGRLVPEKAPDQLVEAFAGLPGEQRLVLVGGSAYTDDYAARLRRLADRDRRVVLTGHVQGAPLAELYANASCFVLPSLLEGLPLTLLEAIAYGLPVVVSDIAPHLEVVRSDGPGHRVFRAGEIADLQRALRQVRETPADELVGAAALRDRVMRDYDWDIMFQRVEAVYHEVARAPRERRSGRLRSALQRGEARREIVAPGTDTTVDLEHPSR